MGIFHILFIVQNSQAGYTCTQFRFDGLKKKKKNVLKKKDAP